MKTERESAGNYLILSLSLPQVFNGINDNQKIKKLCAISFYMNKVEKYNYLN